MIARNLEIKELNRLYDNNKAELVTVYGRIGNGKTYLIDTTFSGRITFKHTALSPVDNHPKGLLKLQLKCFYNTLPVLRFIAKLKCKLSEETSNTDCR